MSIFASSFSASSNKYCADVGANWALLAATRFFLAMVVMQAHLRSFDHNQIGDVFSLFGAKAAVVGFFIISGYSVAASLDRQPRNFLLRRFARIYPAYSLSLVAALLLQQSLGEYQSLRTSFHPSDAFEVVGNFLLTQVYLCKAMIYNHVVWSLSIEFSFYVMLFALGRRMETVIIPAFVISVAYFSIPRGLMDHALFATFMKLNMVRYLWPFLLGVAIRRWGFSPVVLAGAFLGGSAFTTSDATVQPLSLVTYALVLGVIAFGFKLKVKRENLMTYLGDLSYPVYLFHVPVGLFMAAVLGVSHVFPITIACLVVSAIVLRYFETPARIYLSNLGSVRPRQGQQA